MRGRLRAKGLKTGRGRSALLRFPAEWHAAPSRQIRTVSSAQVCRGRTSETNFAVDLNSPPRYANRCDAPLGSPAEKLAFHQVRQTSCNAPPASRLMPCLPLKRYRASVYSLRGGGRTDRSVTQCVLYKCRGCAHHLHSPWLGGIRLPYGDK
ncbi:hypothetical protein AAFF_G00359410 [Aldrovandia affinis]|uniref:Uncharacterized protein n=1 Tax=Aldrovandia affinis TaxID=143900 RepID=A0AAD7SI12_9TELE|nr:hypothetical protein AAFF_G00359410 [Aldrovandia affinis]